jgi:His-Xaa-Ser system protein HxsD
MSMLPTGLCDQITLDFLELHLDAQVFSREGIFKCFYWYSNAYLIELTREENCFKVIIRSKSETGLTEPEYLYKKIKQDLLDFQLREIITIQTANVRDLLIAKAFANGALDQEVNGDFGDPIQSLEG